MKKKWHMAGNHVWYFADVDRLATVDDFQHWYWYYFCRQAPHAIYLGKL